MKDVKINNKMCNIFDNSFWLARDMPFILTIIEIIAHFNYQRTHFTVKLNIWKKQ